MLNNQEAQRLITPLTLLTKYSASPASLNFVKITRQTISDILHRRDRRLVIIVGPCSIHDPNAALAYARKLKEIAEQHAKNLLIVMRCYFSKPRTTLGWSGLINDPALNNSHDINGGLHIARKLLLDINSLGLPCATEFLDPFTPAFINDLISWSAIGARTVESQIHRHLASGLPMPVGFKNSTSGSIEVAINAVLAAHHPQHFLTINQHGQSMMAESTGNPTSHIILRGSVHAGPNYTENHITRATSLLEREKLNSSIMIDCSHGNSGKQAIKQLEVLDNVCQQVAYCPSITGVMLESFLQAGKQILQAPNNLVFGQSITDECLSWEKTEHAIHTLSEYVEQRNNNIRSGKAALNTIET